MWHAGKPVIAHLIQGKKNLVFQSATECAEFFTLEGHKLFPENIRRLCQGDGLWEYEENGKTYQVIFDELVTEDTVKGDKENGE